MNKAILLGSASVAALAAAPAAAFAQEDGVTYSVELGALFSSLTVDAQAIDKVGVVDVSSIGGRAAISLGKQVDPFWDLRISGSINKFVPGQAEGLVCAPVYEECGPAGAAGRFGFTNLDLEVGYSPEALNNADVRLFAGVRGLYYHDEQSVDKLGGFLPEDYTYASYFGAFAGIGPRIGAETTIRHQDGKFGFSGLFSAAALYGVERGTRDRDGFVSVTEEFKSVFNLEGSLGLDYYFNDGTAKVTLGYRGEVLAGVGPGLSTSDTRFVHGPTIKLTGVID